MNKDDFNTENLDELKGIVFDENDDGCLDDIVEFKKNSDGRIEEVSLDFNSDGIADAKLYFEYDNLGRLIKKSKDKNLSGKINSVTTYKYDENGKVSVYYDNNADGETDFIETFDKNGNSSIEDVRNTSKKIMETAKDIIIPDKFKKFLDK